MSTTDLPHLSRRELPGVDRMPTDMGAVHEYRLYIYGKDGSPLGPGRPIAADNDEEAIAQAKTHIDRQNAMLCDGVRVVQEFGPKTKK
jgi:hypothetical protein